VNVIYKIDGEVMNVKIVAKLLKQFIVLRNVEKNIGIKMIIIYTKNNE